MNLAAGRPEPIPFYAEMGSTNPLFILPGAMAARGREIAAQLHASFTLGGGQFCTKPGMVFVPESEDSAIFLGEFREKVAHSPKFSLLTSGIAAAYRRETQGRRGRSDVSVVAEGEQPSAEPTFLAGAAVFETDVPGLLASSDLGSEVFGPSTLLVRFSGKEQILHAARSLGGDLELVAQARGTCTRLRILNDPYPAGDASETPS